MGGYRRVSKLYRLGVADIIGILPDSRLFAIEVKTRRGKLAEHQKMFLDEISSRGGVSFVARSLEDVERGLAKYIEGENARGVVVTEPEQGCVSS